MLKGHLPEPKPRTIRTPSIGRNHQSGHRGITSAAHPIQPEANAVDGELSGVMVDPQTDIALVGADVVDSKGDDLAQFRILEVVSVDLDRLALGPIVAAAILEFADQLFLLRVDGNHGLIGGLERFHLGVDVFELGVALRNPLIS